uniref:Uncharacterized protein TCIL3000_11_6550 n=1 Tax=Trypanosoma congolense (strain IL3000) TaxID=1068625 RepID=G0V0Q8_TRYCI|nr:unnamed protein product [Trypanosoma congolense IL3000]
MRDIRLVVVGDSGVGKSCLIIQYIQSRFVVRYEATIEDVYRKTVEVDGQLTLLTIADTSSQDIYSALRYQYIEDCHGVVLVFSITDADSFSHLKTTYAQICRVIGARSIPCVLVGNKVDEEAHRAVSSEAAGQFADQLMCPLLEVTAKDHLMSRSVFEMLVRSIRGGESFIGAMSPRGKTVSTILPDVTEESPQVEVPSTVVRNDHAKIPSKPKTKKNKEMCVVL